MKIGGLEFKNYTYVMAIINLTPDSFYAESRKNCDNVLYAVEKAVNGGASVIDVGAQSTRPGFTLISADEEIRRFLKPIEMIKKRFDLPLSIDTFYSKSARAALEAGADMVNDVWGLTYDGDMAKTAAEFNASVCIMHNSPIPLSGDIWKPVEDFLKNSADIALEAGVDKDKIIIDGGIGFAKNREQNFELLDNYERLNALGYPTLLGCSRKSMFGGKPEDRLPQTIDATLLACKKGVLFVRVHDVKENADAIRRFYGR